MKHLQRLSILAFALGLVLSWSVATASAQSKWETIKRESGITVSKRELPNFDLPEIRGVGTINANIFDVLAVLDKTDTHASWMHDCAEARLLKATGDFERILYNRTKTPWPLDDRDVVVRATIKVNPKTKTIRIVFKNIRSPLQGERDGIVRMPVLEGFYKLQYIDDAQTRITYQAKADPGGLIPDLVVESGSKDIPLNTIRSLRKRVMSTKGTYTDFLKRWDPRHGGPGFDIAAK